MFNKIKHSFDFYCFDLILFTKVLSKTVKNETLNALIEMKSLTLCSLNILTDYPVKILITKH